MDSGTIITLLEYAGNVIVYVKGVLGAADGKKQLTLVLVQLRGLLSTLVDLVQEVENEDWSLTLAALLRDGGPLAELKHILEEITNEICGPHTETKIARIRAATEALKWPFDEKRL